MTLKEKFKVLNCTDCDMPYCDTKCTLLSTRELETLEKIAEEFAVGFSEFCSKYRYKNRNFYEDMLHATSKYDDAYTTKELLEIYKKEKGL